MTRNVNTQAVADLVGDIARALVDRPEFVKINSVSATAVTMLEVSVAPRDTAMIVGRGGRSAMAIRQILFAIGGKAGMRFTLEVLEPDETIGGTDVVRRRAPSSPNRETEAFTTDFERDPVGATGTLLERVTRALVDHVEQVEIRALVGTQIAVYEIHLDQRDVPRVLGRGGKTVGALREITLNLGKKVGFKYSLEIVDPVARVSKTATATR